MAEFVGTSDEDREVLEGLFDATGGLEWRQRKGWKTTLNLYEWYGVTVNTSSGRVERLKLIDNNLKGSVPENLYKMDALRDLNLSYNELRGEIPKTLGRMSGLRTLVLLDNSLSGHIPEELGEMAALRGLNLDRNQLCGPIPAALGKLKGVVNLNLARNHLEGPIPEELGEMRSMKVLVLLGNQLRGRIPVGFGKFRQLRILSIVDNKLDVFPREAAEGLAAIATNLLAADNPWTEPPADVLKIGVAYAARFLKDLEDYGRTSSNRLKVVLVGLGNAGKTSVAVRLSGPPYDALPAAEERTVGVEIWDIQFGPGSASDGSGGNAGLDVKLWDFAGQRAYYDTHQMFLTPDALFILVVDMHAYSEGAHTRKDALEQWLDILQSRVPGSVVLLVGTHGDSFDSPTERNKRVECFLKDKDDIMERIRCECKDAETRATQESARDGGQRDGDLQPDRRHQPLRVVVKEELLALNLTLSGGMTTGQLRGLIEGVAYGVHDGYSFPSVECKVPYPHFLAFATLEAVRYGVDLCGSGGEPAEVARRLSGQQSEEGRPFIRFSEALPLFLQVAAETRTFEGDPTEGERIFRAAIKLHEGQGAILLTCSDVGGERESDDEALEEHLMIHVNPAWFADIVRRVADIRLLDPAGQGKVAEAIKRLAPLQMVQALSRQHSRFFHAGEVSRDYMRFLWNDREMELGPSSPRPKAPPLEMSEETITIMIESLLHLRFMFRVRDDDGGGMPDRYIVASCLPDHVGCAVDPENLLELGVGGAIFSVTLEFVGVHSMPPGLMPRMLAWCGQGNARITAYWKRGVCFAFNRKHLVLLIERQDAELRSVIECHAMGSEHDEEAGGTLNDVVTELGRLVSDDNYGFPGVGLYENGEIKRQKASSDVDLETLLLRFEAALEDHMNVKFDELARKSDIIAGCLRDHLHGAEERMRTFELKADEMLGEMRHTIFPKLDFIAAVTSRCLLVAVREGNPCPRLVRVEEDVTHTPTRSRFSHFRRKAMDPFRRKRRKSSIAEQSGPKRYRVRFLCAYDMSAADCGPDGQGYVVETQEDWQRWIQKCLPLVQVALWLLRVGVSVVARADIVPVDAVIDELRGIVGENAAAYIEAIDLNSVQARNGGISAKAEEQKEVFGQAYADLAKFVAEQEECIVGNTRDLGAGEAATVGGGATSANAAGGAGKQSFEGDMVLESRQRGNDPPEWAWVRVVNLDKWQKFESPDEPTPAAQPTDAASA
ncbi:unnamed protein product [Scytosiphon promiscuus]